MAGFESFLLRLSLEVIATYDGSVPLHRFLANWFREHKKLGSRDRRGIRELVYSYFRLGRALEKESPEMRMQIALFLTQEKAGGLFTDLLSRSLFANIAGDFYSFPLKERIEIVGRYFPEFNPADLFPFAAILSNGVEEQSLQWCLLRQPYVWLRLKTLHREKVLDEFVSAGIEVLMQFSEQTIAVAPSSALDNLSTYQQGCFEIQDLASQRTAEIFTPAKGEKWWDCCAASGGKSLLLLDRQPDIQLTVSDVRKSILVNLQERFQRNKYAAPELLVADLTLGDIPSLRGRKFDGVMVDVPCSGSGTWSRTPESIRFFNEHSLSGMQQLQLNIATTASNFLRKGGTMVYSTCSVFSAENEEVVQQLISLGGLRCEEQRIYQESGNRADTLFAARLIKE
jgi:16S rRNA (cytosine967-C5)-methyltransferase